MQLKIWIISIFLNYFQIFKKMNKDPLNNLVTLLITIYRTFSPYYRNIISWVIWVCGGLTN